MEKLLKTSNTSSKMETLIKIENVNDELTVDSRIIAEELGIQHKNLLETIDKYLMSIESEFGRVAFETDFDFQAITGIKRRKLAYLTEDQAIFIGTLSRNSEQAVRFKIRLVKSFSAARKMAESFSKPLNTLDLMELALNQMKQHDRRLSEAENDIEKLKAIVDTDPDYYTIKAFANISRVTVNDTTALKLGRNAVKLCKESGLPVDKVKDSRFGEVNSYPKSILKKIFSASQK